MRAPDGRPMVLLQLPDGHVLMTPGDALAVARAIVEVSRMLAEQN